MRHLKNQKGTSTLLWLVTLPVLLAFGIYSIDLNNLNVASAELQAAADAAALRGANLLYVRNAKDVIGNPKDGDLNQSGYIQNNDASVPSAIAGAQAVASSFKVRGQSLIVDTPVLGHWKFESSRVDQSGIQRGGIFSAWDPATMTWSRLINSSNNNVFYTFQELNSFDGSTGTPKLMDVNAVQVTVRSPQNAIQSFFRNFLNRGNFNSVSATAVAYVGFPAGAKINAPLAICIEAVEQSVGVYSCEDNAYNPGSTYKIKWTDLMACGGAVSTPAINNTIDQMEPCGGAGLNVEIPPNNFIRATNGSVSASFQKLHKCWWEDEGAYDKHTVGTMGNNNQPVGACNPTNGVGTACGPDKVWPLNLALIRCGTGTPTPICNQIIGAISVDVVWMVNNRNQEKPPIKMGDWKCANCTDTNSGEEARWDEFRAEFGIDGPADFKDNENNEAVYISEDCNTNVMISSPTGGALNSGTRSSQPVLVY